MDDETKSMTDFFNDGEAPADRSQYYEWALAVSSHPSLPAGQSLTIRNHVKQQTVCLITPISMVEEADVVNMTLLVSAPMLLDVAKHAPVLSQYHGAGGFEVERFIKDYEDWSEKKRSAITFAEGKTPDMIAFAGDLAQMRYAPDDENYRTPDLSDNGPYATPEDEAIVKERGMLSVFHLRAERAAEDVVAKAMPAAAAE